MRILKLDRRFHGHGRWAAALQFTKSETLPRWDQLRQPGFVSAAKYRERFAAYYGKATHWSDDGLHRLIKNENWAWDCERRRIYFKDPSIITMIMLQLSAVST